MKPLKHGTLSGYSYHHCRCNECRWAFSDYMSAWRQQAREAPLPAYAPHGSTTTYRNYGCRCDECRTVAVASVRAYRARKKAAQ